jgi:hypothetical protein
VQYWQLRSHLSVEQAAQRIGIPRDRYRAVVVSRNDRFTKTPYVKSIGPRTDEQIAP